MAARRCWVEDCDIWPNLESQYLRAPQGGSSTAKDGEAAAGREGLSAPAAAAAAAARAHTRTVSLS